MLTPTTPTAHTAVAAMRTIRPRSNRVSLDFSGVLDPARTDERRLGVALVGLFDGLALRSLLFDSAGIEGLPLFDSAGIEGLPLVDSAGIEGLPLLDGSRAGPTGFAVGEGASLAVRPTSATDAS